MNVGQEVVQFGSDGLPCALTKIVSVLTKGKKVTGYETADGGKWDVDPDGAGRRKTGPYSSESIRASTPVQVRAFRLRLFSSRLSKVSRAEWETLPLEELEAMWKKIKAKRDAK